MGQVIGWDRLLVERQQLLRESKVVVWTNGCFDLLHVGHLHSLQQARTFGDVLVVGINSDASVRQLKGPGRPLLPQDQRAELLAGLACVDYAVIFDERTPEAAVARLRPDIHCKGADYGPGRKAVPEAAVVQTYGGQVRYLPLVASVSTSELIRRICQLGEDGDDRR
jgi:rfaE bifunctional protein nucleotidyltransferase chain/domain